MSNIAMLLDEAGSELGHIVKIVVYLTDIRYREAVYRSMGKWLKGVFPVSTGLVVHALARPEWVVEIDATAVIPDGYKPKEEEQEMTFSIAARCADTGMFGIAVSSSSPAVAARCAHARRRRRRLRHPEHHRPAARSQGPRPDGGRRHRGAGHRPSHPHIALYRVPAIDRGRCARRDRFPFRRSDPRHPWRRRRRMDVVAAGNLLRNAEIPAIDGRGVPARGGSSGRPAADCDGRRDRGRRRRRPGPFRRHADRARRARGRSPICGSIGPTATRSPT